MSPDSIRQRLEAGTTTDPSTGCLIWSGWVTRRGYGVIHANGRKRQVHRVSYEVYVGPIPDGLTLDHLCGNKACCNPAHLEPVTAAENHRRWARSVTHCRKAGHPFTVENTMVDTKGHRRCRECHRLKLRERYRRIKGRAA